MIEHPPTPPHPHKKKKRESRGDVRESWRRLEPLSLSKGEPIREPGPEEGPDGILVLPRLRLLYEKHTSRE